MEREFLKSLGLEKEVIDTIMQQYGKDMSEKLGTINSLTETKTSLENQLKGFADYDEIKTKLASVETEFNTFKETSAAELEESKNQLNAMNLTHAINLAVEREHTRDTKAFMAHLDTSKISLDENGALVGFEEQAKSIHENQSYLFEDNKPTGLGTGTLGDPNNQPMSMLEAIKDHYSK